MVVLSVILADIDLTNFTSFALVKHMKILKQRYRTDCVPTCIAMITDVSHRKAMEATHPFHFKGMDWRTDDHEAVHALKRLGWRAKTSLITLLTKIKRPALIMVEGKVSFRISGTLFDSEDHCFAWNPKTRELIDPSFGIGIDRRSFRAFKGQVAIEISPRH